MACVKPMPYLVPADGGKPRPLMSDYDIGRISGFGRVVYLPCGNCIPCRRERRQDYTCLQLLESSMYDDNWFLTLTYDDAHLPANNSLNKLHVSTFLESLRHYCKYNGYPARYFGCGEYGDKFDRPHYHLSIFGLTPTALGLFEDDSNLDRLAWLQYGFLKSLPSGVKDENGNRYWKSKIISDRWPYGNHQLYRANRETFQYVAGYVVKKLTGIARKQFIKSGRVPSYCFQSRPSIGYTWWLKHRDDLSVIFDDVLYHDNIDVPGMSWRIPRICMKWLERVDPSRLDDIKAVRFKDLPSVPDREDLARKAKYEEHRALRFEQTNTHKEIN